MADGESAARPLVVYFGTSSRGVGVEVFEMDRETGGLTKRSETAFPGRGWIDLDPSERFLYAAIDGDAVASFAVDRQTGALSPLNTSPTGTLSWSYLTVDPTGRFVIGASYAGGAVSVVSINPDGSLGEVTDVVKHVGPVPGPHPDQTQPKAHQCPFDLAGRWIAVNDLGLDRTYAYRLDTASGKLIANVPGHIQYSLGRGPRHIAFHPNNRFAYVINELSSEMTALRWDPAYGTFENIDTRSTLPEDWAGRMWSAQVQVHPTGKWVYGSNRGAKSGSDDIVIFQIDQGSGWIGEAGHAAPRGKTARNFAIDPSGRFLVCVHQDSDNAVVFRVDQETGLLSPAGEETSIVNAVCTRFAPGIG